MPTLPMPLPIWPIPVPWPAPVPGVPAPAPGPTLPPAIVIPSPSPPAAQGPQSFWGPFADLFKFPIDVRFVMALLFLLLTVDWLNETYPEYVWWYVWALLLGYAYMRLH